MVIIKYNTMAMSIKTFSNSHQSRKRTLRSSQKHSPQYNNPTGCSSDQKVIDQIKKQIDHQELINASKSTYPVLEDIKVFQEQLPEKELKLKSEKKANKQKIKSQIYDNHAFSERAPEMSQDLNENSLDQKIKSKEKIQRPEVNISTPPSKSMIRHHKMNQNSPYKEQRKSYRKINRRTISSIPYRKCQDQFQQKIVTLMNKICHRKNNQKDIETLCQKMQKISSKDLYNPYVISGIQSVLNLLEKSHQINVTCLSKLKNQVQNLSQKILMQLGRTDEYQKIIIEQKKVNIDITKPVMMRKIYKMLVKSHQIAFKQARQKSFYICEQFFEKCNNQANEDDILMFLKQPKFLHL